MSWFEFKSEQWAKIIIISTTYDKSANSLRTANLKRNLQNIQNTLITRDNLKSAVKLYENGTLKGVKFMWEMLKQRKWIKRQKSVGVLAGENKR